MRMLPIDNIEEVHLIRFFFFFLDSIRVDYA
jgi:hypothetical protein